MEWKEKLHENILSDIATMEDLAINTDEYMNAVSDVNSMIDRLNEAEKIELEKEKLKADKKDRIIKNVLTGLTFLGSAAVTIWGTLYSDHYDEEKIRSNEAGKAHIRNWLDFMRRR